MQLEPKDDELEEEVDELAQSDIAGSAAAAGGASVEESSMMDDDKEGKEAAATLLQASTSLPTLHSASNPPPSTAPSTSNETSQQPHQQQSEQDHSQSGPICANCSTQTTSLWRRSPEGQTLCNACSLYQKMKGTPRPVSLKTDVIKHRNRSKGDRKSTKAAAAAAAAAANEKDTANASSSTSAAGTGTKGKKSTSSSGNRTRQSSLAPSTASSVIREEDMEDEDVDSSYFTGNGSHLTEGDMSNMSLDASSHRLPNGHSHLAVQEHAQKKARTSLDPSHRHHTPLTPAQLQAQAAQAAAAAQHRRPPNATSIPDARSARARELAAALALANAGSSVAAGGAAAAGIGRRAVSVDGRLTPTHGGHAPPIPWNIASYFSGMAERERQNKAAQATAAYSSSSYNPSPAAAAATTSRANTASQPNSAPSSATVSPTGSTLPDPSAPLASSSSSSSSTLPASALVGLTPTQQAQAQAAHAAQLAARSAPYTPHPHSNFLAAYRARQVAAQQASEEYNKMKLAAAEREKVEKGKERSVAKEKENQKETILAPHKEWSPLVVSRTDPRLANLAGPSSANSSHAADQARMAHLSGWKAPRESHSQSSRSRHASPYSRSASASREGSRHNTPPASSSSSSATVSNTAGMNYIQSHPTGPTRLLFGLPTLYPRSTSTDRYGPNAANGRSIGAGGNSGMRNYDSMTEEDREKQKARLDQLFAAAGQRLSAAQHAQAAKNAAALASGQSISTNNKTSDSAPPSAHSTPHLKDLANASESAVGRSPANAHHASYKPYDLAHRSSSRAGAGHSSAPSSTVLGPRTSPNHLTSSLNLGANAKHERRAGSPGSQSSSSEHDGNGLKKRHVPGITSPLLHATLSPPFAASASGKNLLGEDSMAIDEVDEEAFAALENQEGLDGLPGLRNTINAHSVGSRDPASQSPPFGVAYSSNASERRGRSTTRKTRDPNGPYGDEDVLGHHVGDHVAHELGAMRMRDSSRSSSQIRTDSRSPDRYATSNNNGKIGISSFPELPRFSHISQMAHAQANMSANAGAGYPRSSIPTAELDDGIVKNALTHRPISDLRASSSPHHTLPSLSEALSSSASSRSISTGRTGSSRHSSAARTAMSHRTMMEDAAGGMLPPPHFGHDEAARLRTRIQELEFINGLMESRVAELESAITSNPEKASTIILAPHGPNCSCRCSEIDSEALKAAEHLKKELLTHGVGGIGEQASRDLLDLLAHRLGYKTAASASPSIAAAGRAGSPAAANGSHLVA